MTCRPGHAAKHPDFATGNFDGERHGALSPRRVSPLAAEHARQTVEAAPWLSRPAFARLVASLAWVEAQIDRVRTYIAERGGPLDADGNPLPAANYLDRLEARASNLRARAGLDPLSLANLLRTTSELSDAHSADVLEALRAEGRKLLAAHEARLAAADGHGAVPDSNEEPPKLSSGTEEASEHRDGSQGDTAVTPTVTDAEERDT
jgi:hypothetical protein